MTVMEAIRVRKSVRAYQDRPLEEEKLSAVLEAGRLAPSARNEQDWKFVVVTDGTLRRSLGEACCNQTFVGEAPAVLVICANNGRDMRCGQPARTIDCSIALSFMLLEAAEQGLGTCWIGSFDPDAVRALLNIPDDYAIVAVTPLGYPAREEPSRPRKAAEQIIVRNRFNG